MPSYNQIGFDSLWYIIGLVEMNGSSAVGWMVGGLADDQGNASVDPATKAILPLNVAVHGAGALVHVGGGHHGSGHGDKPPVFSFRMDFQLDAQGQNVAKPTSLFGSAICGNVPTYGIFLQALGLCNPQTDVLSFVGAANVAYKGAQSAPAGVGTVAFTATSDGVTATLTGLSLQLSQHLASFSCGSDDRLAGVAGLCARHGPNGGCGRNDRDGDDPVQRSRASGERAGVPDDRCRPRRKDDVGFALIFAVVRGLVRRFRPGAEAVSESLPRHVRAEPRRSRVRRGSSVPGRSVFRSLRRHFRPGRSWTRVSTDNMMGAHGDDLRCERTRRRGWNGGEPVCERRRRAAPSDTTYAGSMRSRVSPDTIRGAYEDDREAFEPIGRALGRSWSLAVAVPSLRPNGDPRGVAALREGGDVRATKRRAGGTASPWGRSRRGRLPRPCEPRRRIRKRRGRATRSVDFLVRRTFARQGRDLRERS